MASDGSDSNQWSAMEKEPFLSNPPAPKHRRRTFILVGAIWLASHIVLFTILSYAFSVTVQNVLHSSFAGGQGASSERVAQFGGLPVRYDDPIGPYVTCESAGSPSAALEAGCGFDLFANGWSPGPCFDAKTHHHFVNKHDYFFWEDEEKQHRVHQNTILKGTLEYPELFVSFEEHYEHCRYLLNTTKRYAHDPGLGVLDIHLDEEHMNHCIDFLAESRDRYYLEEDVIAIFGYKKCFLPGLKSV